MYVYICGCIYIWGGYMYKERGRKGRGKKKREKLTD